MITCALFTVYAFSQPAGTHGNCGLNSLYIALKSLNSNVPSIEELESHAIAAAQGPGYHSLHELQSLAANHVPFSRCARVDLSYIRENLNNAAFVVHWHSHFAVVGGVD